MKGLKLDPFLVMLFATVVVATLFPAQDSFAGWAGAIGDAGVVLLFFLHGARLSTQAISAGIRAWPVHLAVIVATFVMFPVLGVATRALTAPWLNPTIGAGVVLLCIMPSTVQSSIAFTSQAGGHIAAAVCSASLSSILGVVLTPMLAAWLLSSTHGAMPWDVIGKVAMQLLLPFVIGHVLRAPLKPFLDQHKYLLSFVDRGVILLIVYNAFSAAIIGGLWTRYSGADLGWTLLICIIILALALGATVLGARLMKLSWEDQIVVIFCGSKKSLVSGVPIASAIFPAALVGPMIVPLMLFHQLQLLACAVLAQRFADISARRAAAPAMAAPAEP